MHLNLKETTMSMVRTVIAGVLFLAVGCAATEKEPAQKKPSIETTRIYVDGMM